MAIVLLIITGCMLFIWIVYYLILLNRLRFKDDQYDVLNTMYVLTDNKIRFGYELMDIKKTILSNKIEFCDFKEGVSIKYELTDENRRHIRHLTKDEQAAIYNAPSYPLSKRQTRIMIDAIKTSRKHMAFVKEQEDYFKFSYKYKKANANKAVSSELNTMTHFQKELEEEEQLYKEKIKSLQLNLSH